VSYDRIVIFGCTIRRTLRTNIKHKRKSVLLSSMLSPVKEYTAGLLFA